MFIVIIIIIIVLHDVGFNRPVLASSNSLFKALPLACNSALLLASRCCSLLLYVAASLISA